ncbi:MAG: alanine racemase [Clostridia bacterium]|nr:alanine racemase [Clostridia bacterium]
MDGSYLHKEYRVCAVVDLDVIERNVDTIRACSKKAKIMAVVKADAYGHGAVKVAQRIESGVDSFAVAIPEEGIELRRAGITKPILILGETTATFYNALLEYSLTPSVTTLTAAESLAEYAQKKEAELGVQIAVDTGMSRLGFLSRSAVEPIKTISSYKNLKIEGIYSHLACSDCKSDPYTALQRKRFFDFKRRLKRAKIYCHNFHLSNSADILEEGELFDTVRAGIMLYGLYPSAEVARTAELQPAMSLVSHIAYLHTVPKGTGVSYGRTYITQRRTNIATIPVGYADGYPRALSNKARVIIHGQSAPVIGRVTMDQFMVDVTDIKYAREGDEVILMGGDNANRITADELAAHAGTIHYEIVTGISKRVPRVYIN